MTRILVDVMPKKPEQCLFAKYNYDGMHKCKLANDGMCCLDLCCDCNKLVSLHGARIERT